MHSGEPRQEVRSRQGSCVCVCAWLHSGEGRTAHFNVHALSVSDRSTCSTNSQLLPLPRRPPAISGLPIFRMVRPECVSSTADPVADATATAQVLWGCPSAGYRGSINQQRRERQNGGRTSRDMRRGPPRLFGWEGLCARLPALAITSSILLGRSAPPSVLSDQLLVLVLLDRRSVCVVCPSLQ